MYIMQIITHIFLSLLYWIKLHRKNTEWRNTIASKPKLGNFVKFKLVYQTELYVSSLLPKSKRSLLSQFRCGVLPLATETGRYRQIPSNERYCTFCDENAIEDEIHFSCTCNFYCRLSLEIHFFIILIRSNPL